MFVAPRGSTYPMPSAMIERTGMKWRMMIVAHGMIGLTMCHTGTVMFEGCCG
jgi:hypothetical protein